MPESTSGFDIIGSLGAVAGAGQTIYNQRYNQRMITEGRNYDRAEWNRTYDKTRGDALKDRDYNNNYSSPSQQMARLKDAGLNPHLVYGNGAQTTASEIRDAKPNNRTSPVNRQERSPNPVNDYMSISQMQAQTNLTQAQKDLTLANRDTTVFDLKYKEDMRSNSVTADIAKRQGLQEDARKTLAEQRKIDADTDYTKHQDKRADELQKENLKHIAQQIAQSESDVKTAEALRTISKSDLKIKQMEVVLKGYGIDSHSSSLANDIVRLLNSTVEQGLRKKLREIANRPD